MNTRVVDTNEYVSVLRELAEEGRVVSMLIAGSSMSPFLCHNRDYIYFTRQRTAQRGYGILPARYRPVCDAPYI